MKGQWTRLRPVGPNLIPRLTLFFCEGAVDEAATSWPPSYKAGARKIFGVLMNLKIRRVQRSLFATLLLFGFVLFLLFVLFFLLGQ